MDSDRLHPGAQFLEVFRRKGPVIPQFHKPHFQPLILQFIDDDSRRAGHAAHPDEDHLGALATVFLHQAAVIAPELISEPLIRFGNNRDGAVHRFVLRRSNPGNSACTAAAKLETRDEPMMSVVIIRSVSASDGGPVRDLQVEGRGEQCLGVIGLRRVENLGRIAFLDYLAVEERSRSCTAPAPPSSHG